MVGLERECAMVKCLLVALLSAAKYNGNQLQKTCRECLEPAIRPMVPPPAPCQLVLLLLVADKVRIDKDWSQELNPYTFPLRSISYVCDMYGQSKTKH